jgi:MFS family permease
MHISRVNRLAATARPRGMTALFSGAALMNAAMAVASSVGTIIAGDRFGARWAAIPNTAGIVGTGIGALALTWLMNHYGRRIGLLSGYLTSACGAVVAIAAVAARDVTALSTGMLLLGLGNAGAQLSRYVAADLYPAERRGFAISTVVWAGAIGAVGGPLLLGPSSELGASLGWTGFTGPYLFVSLATLGAALAATTGGIPARTTATPAVVAPPRAGGASGAASEVSVGDVATDTPVVTAAVDGTPATLGVAAGAASGGTSISPSDLAQDTAGIAAAGGISARTTATPAVVAASRSDGVPVGEVVGGATVGAVSLEGMPVAPGGACVRDVASADGRPGMGDGVPAGVAVSRVRFREVARASGAALAVMVTAQVVMVAVMTAAPLDMHMHGQGLGAVGMTLSAHTLGMFAFSPLTGRLLDSVGARPVTFAGLLVLAVATVLAATTPESVVPLRTGALFLLGYGWNLCFVGGSGRLAADLPDSARANVEGTVDAAVWGIAAAASLASTAVLSAGGYGALAWGACALIALPAALLRTEAA